MASYSEVVERTKIKLDPLEQISEQIRRGSEVCEVLEALADDLPRRPPPVWREARRLCRQVLSRHFRAMAEVLVPVLMQRTRGEIDCQLLLNRFQADYVDETHRLTDLEDLIADALSKDRCKIDAEALGFALRGYFEAIRRHINWEIDVLLPLATRRLTQEDRVEIETRMTATRLQFS